MILRILQKRKIGLLERETLTSEFPVCAYTQAMADDTALDEIQDNTREAGQRLRASLSLMRSQGMLDDNKYHELATRLSTALAMTEAAFLEARRRREM